MGDLPASIWLCSEPGLLFHLPGSCEKSPRAGRCPGVSSLGFLFASGPGQRVPYCPASPHAHIHGAHSHPRGLCVSTSAGPPQNRPTVWPSPRAHTPLDEPVFFCAPFCVDAICSYFMMFKIHLKLFWELCKNQTGHLSLYPFSNLELRSPHWGVCVEGCTPVQFCYRKCLRAELLKNEETPFKSAQERKDDP